MESVRKALVLKHVEELFWSDSTTVLAWIRRQEDWGTSVGNRVNEIRRTTRPEQWYHVPGLQNPADLPSRGCSPVRLVETRWWEGLGWLRQSRDNWYVGNHATDEKNW